jgi:putative toxin-antitoxin system antitoxin component (TIGR02293 family)
MRDPERGEKPLQNRVGGSREDSLETGQPQKRGSAEEVAEFAKVLAHAVETFGSRENANAWLNRPSRVFGHRSPLQILTQDPSSVEEELVRIDHGMFV